MDLDTSVHPPQAEVPWAIHGCTDGPEAEIRMLAQRV